jgi:hypothetical protein
MPLLWIGVLLLQIRIRLSILMLTQIRILSQVLHMFSRIFFTYTCIHSHASLQGIFLIIVIGVIFSLFWTRYRNFLEKVYLFGSGFGSESGSAGPRCRSYRIQIHNAGRYFSLLFSLILMCDRRFSHGLTSL